MVFNQPDHCWFMIAGSNHILKHEIRDIKTGIMGKLGQIWGSNVPFYDIFMKKVEKKSKWWCLSVKIPSDTFLQLFTFVFEQTWGLLWSLRPHLGPNPGVNKSFFTLFEKCSTIKILNWTRYEGWCQDRTPVSPTYI